LKLLIMSHTYPTGIRMARLSYPDEIPAAKRSASLHQLQLAKRPRLPKIRRRLIGVVFALSAKGAC
jgi:hypothetical protein